MRALAVLVGLAATVSVAFADGEPVRDDIVDLRHHRYPAPLRFVGWTGDGRAVLHVAPCGFEDGSGAPSCSASLVVVGADRGERATKVLEPEVDPSVAADGIALPWRVPPAMASRAIHDEAALFAAIGPLAPGAAMPTTALAVTYDSCWVHLAAGAPGSRRTIAPVLTIGPGACIANGHDLFVKRAGIVDVHASPDGRRLAVTVEIVTVSLDAYASSLKTVIVAAPRD
jgi:hypothetical protein